MVPLPFSTPDSSTTGIPMLTANDPRLTHRPTWLVTLLDTMRRRAERVAQEHLALCTLRSLNHLDARTLRDIGLDTGELSSAAREAAALIERTRLRVWSPLDTRG